jgi:hypothetical protein
VVIFKTHGPVEPTMHKISRISRNDTIRRRHYSLSNNNNSAIKRIALHSFDINEAARLFAEADAKRLFGRSGELIQGLTTAYNTRADRRPLQSYYLPYFFARAHIDETRYNAQYGLERVSTHVDSKGHVHTRIHIDWWYTSGSVGPFSTDGSTSNDMRLYAGFGFDQTDAEEAVGNYSPFDDVVLQTFTPQTLVDAAASVDPFLRRKVLAKREFIERIHSHLHGLIVSDVQARHWTNHVTGVKFNMTLGSLKMRATLLPFYVLQYDRCPPRLMLGLDAIGNQKITPVTTGSPPPSGLKLGVVNATLFATATSLLLPYSLLARIIGGMVGWFASLWYAAYRDTVRYYFQKERMARARTVNDAEYESAKDRSRREATEHMRRFMERATESLCVDGAVDDLKRQFIMLGLDYRRAHTEAAIREAYLSRIKCAHPDLPGGSHQTAAEINVARDRLLSWQRLSIE